MEPLLGPGGTYYGLVGGVVRLPLESLTCDTLLLVDAGSKQRTVFIHFSTVHGCA